MRAVLYAAIVSTWNSVSGQGHQTAEELEKEHRKTAKMVSYLQAKKYEQLKDLCMLSLTKRRLKRHMKGVF